MQSHETAFHVINCHVPVCHAVVPSRKWTMWLFRYVIVISYKCSITSTEVAPTLIPTSEELRPPRLKKGQRVAQGPWWESCVFGPNEEAFRPQYRRDLGAVEEQRRGEQNLEDPDVVFPTSVTLMCFKVKVGAVLPPLLLSFVYLFCQFTMFQSLVKRHWWGSDCSESFGLCSNKCQIQLGWFSLVDKGRT